MAKLGIGRVLDLSEHRAVAYGRVYPEFWIQAPHDRQHAQTANGAPGPRPHYGKSITAALCAIWTATKSKRWLGLPRKTADARLRPSENPFFQTAYLYKRHTIDHMPTACRFSLV
ncbi:hypothetical protein [Neisseria sp. 74A18]|uniref:hypothetical protein n=1 Tax=Neisseria sp. 74A18 TaxID=1696094 RepID=UPI001E4C7DC2|nr:hypothetical protein [Neisseria sp. 74A18]